MAPVIVAEAIDWSGDEDVAGAKSQQQRMGALPPRYSFFLNPHADLRFSACPKCDVKTKLRKFPLVIHVDSVGLVTLGKTCRLCVDCEILIAHRDEVDRLIDGLRPQELAGTDREYLVLGTVSRQVWRRGLHGHIELEELRRHMADFKSYLRIDYRPRGW